MVGVAQGLERRVVAPEAGGSNPLTHPSQCFFLGTDQGGGFFLLGARAPVAQLDRASDFGSEGCRFESYQAHHLLGWLKGLSEM